MSDEPDRLDLQAWLEARETALDVEATLRTKLTHDLPMLLADAERSAALGDASAQQWLTELFRDAWAGGDPVAAILQRPAR